MFKFIKMLLVLAFIGLLAAGASYAAAYFAVGKYVGPNPPMSDRSVEFSFASVPESKAQPLNWIFTYGSTELRGVRDVTIIISATGKLLGTRPADLGRRIDAWERTQP